MAHVTEPIWPSRRALDGRSAETVDRLLDAGLEVLREQGYDQLSMREVCRRAGLTHATAYGYISAKQHLVAEAYRRRVAQWCAQPLSSGLPYSVVDPRLLDKVGLHAGPSGYGIEVAHFDPAATARDATVTTPGGDRIPVVLNTADGMRMTPRGPGVDSEPRHLIGAIEIPEDAYEARGSDPALDAFVRDWMRGKRIAPITLSATDHDLVVR